MKPHVLPLYRHPCRAHTFAGSWPPPISQGCRAVGVHAPPEQSVCCTQAHVPVSPHPIPMRERPQGPGQGARWRFGAGTGQAGWLAEGLRRGHPTSCLALRGAGAVSTLILESSERSCGPHVCGTAESGCAGQTWSEPSILQAHGESPGEATKRAFLSIADCPGSCFCSLLSSLPCEDVVVCTAVLAGHGTEAARGRLLSCWEETCWETETWAQTQRLPSSLCSAPCATRMARLYSLQGSEEGRP